MSMVNLNTLEAQKKKAEEEKEANIVKAQIKVYEGQTYEARDAYAEAKAKRGKSRAKLPEKIPEDKAFQERLLEASYIKNRVTRPSRIAQVDEYTDEIKSQQKAKETTRILDEQMPALLSKAEQEVEAVKENVYVTSKQTATKTQNALIQSYSTQIKTESERRSAEIKAVNEKWDSNKSPWHDGKTQFGNYAESDNDSRRNTWIKNQNQGKKDTLASVRKSHLTADGWKATSINRGGFIPYPSHPTSQKLYTGEALNQHAVKALQSGTTPSNRWTRYQVEISRANQAVYEGGSLSAHASAVASAKATFDGLDLKEQKSNSAKARVESVNQRSQDQKHWNEVISNTNTSGANQTAITALGLSHNVNDLNASGVSSIYNVGDMTKAGFLPTSATVTLNTSSPNKKVGDTITTRTNTSSDSKTNEENIIQKQYTKDLRDGKVGLADSLLTQRTAGGYTGTNTVNLKTFLAERGYDLSNPETIPDSVFKPVKYDEARKQASYAEKTNTTMGDLRDLIPPIQEVSSSTLQTRQKANAERAGIVGTISKQADMSFAKDKVFGTGSITIQKNASSTNLISGGKFDPFNADPIKAQENKGYTWTVSVPNREKIPTMSGGVFEANAPPTEHTFNSKKEAEMFAKSSQPKVFSGTDNKMWNAFNYANAVDSGEVPHPSTTPTLLDDLQYYSNVSNRPVITMGASVVNLFQSQENQIPVREVASGKLIGGTISDVVGLDPLKGSGVKSAYEYAKEDPLRTALELPAEALMWVTGGKAIQLGARGLGAVKSGLAVSKVIPQPLKAVGTKIESGVNTVTSVPNKIGSKVYDYGTTPRGYGKVGSKFEGDIQFTTPQQVVRYGIVKPYDKLTMFEGSRTGLKLKADYILTPSGRLFVREVKNEAGRFGVSPKQIGMTKKNNEGIDWSNKNKAIIEKADGDIGIIEVYRGKVQKMPSPIMPTAKSFDFKSTVPVKEKVTSYTSFDRVISTRIGKPDLDMAYTRIGDPNIQSPNVFDRLRYTSMSIPKRTKEVKTSIEEIKIYSNPTKSIVPNELPTPIKKINVEGQINTDLFKNPKITSTRTKLQDFKTSTSVSMSKNPNKDIYKFNYLDGHSRVSKDTIVTGVQVKGTANLKTVQGLEETGILESAGKVTTIKGKDYLAGGRQHNEILENAQSKGQTYFTNPKSGKWVKSDETQIFAVAENTGLPIDKIAFKNTIKNSSMLKEITNRNRLIDKVTKKKIPTTRTQEEVPLGETMLKSGTAPIKNRSKSFDNREKLNADGTVTINDLSKVSRTPIKSTETIKAITKSKVKPKLGKSPYSSAYTGSAVGEIVFTSSVISPKSNVRTNVSTDSATITGVQSKIDTRLTQDNVQKLNQQSGLKNKMSIKLDTGLKLKQVQVTASVGMLQTPLKMKTRTSSKKTAGGYITWKPEERRKTNKTKRGKKAGFIGNVRLDNIMGMYKRKEITYGAKKVTKLERQDSRLTSGTSNRISMPSSGLLKTKKKKKSTSMFGSKDEFSGFESKKKKGKKKSKLF